MAGDSKGKGEKQITLRLPKEMEKDMLDFLRKTGQLPLSNRNYFLLGFIYVHELDKKDIGLALRILNRVVATTDNQKVNRLYKALLRRSYKKE